MATTQAVLEGDDPNPVRLAKACLIRARSGRHVVMRFSVSIISSVSILGLAACQPRDVEVRVDGHLADMMAEKNNTGARPINPLAQRISDEYTQSQIEDCAHVSDVSNKVTLARGGNPASGSAERALELVFEGAYELEVGESLAFLDMAENSALHDVVDEEMIGTGKGLTAELTNELNACVPMLSIIYKASFAELMTGAYK